MSKGKFKFSCFYKRFGYVNGLTGFVINFQCIYDPEKMTPNEWMKHRCFDDNDEKNIYTTYCSHSLKFISKTQRKIRYFMKKTNRNWMFLYKNLGKLKKINDMERAMEMGLYVGGNYNFQPDDLPTCLE